MSKPKPMQYFNGRCPLTAYKFDLALVCARSKAEALRVCKRAFGENFSRGELDNYWAGCWPTTAQTFLGPQTEPGAFVGDGGRYFKIMLPGAGRTMPVADVIEILSRIDYLLRVPAAEYVPAIGDVFHVLDAAKCSHELEWETPKIG